MKFVKTQLEIDVYGETVFVAFPTMGMLSLLDTNLGKKGANELEIMLTFLDGLGLKREVANTMEPGHIKQVVEAFKEKKN